MGNSCPGEGTFISKPLPSRTTQTCPASAFLPPKLYKEHDWPLAKPHCLSNRQGEDSPMSEESLRDSRDTNPSLGCSWLGGSAQPTPQEQHVAAALEAVHKEAGAAKAAP